MGGQEGGRGNAGRGFTEVVRWRLVVMLQVHKVVGGRCEGVGGHEGKKGSSAERVDGGSAAARWMWQRGCESRESARRESGTVCLGRLKQTKWSSALSCSLAAVIWQSELLCTTLHPRKHRRIHASIAALILSWTCPQCGTSLSLLVAEYTGHPLCMMHMTQPFLNLLITVWCLSQPFINLLITVWCLSQPVLNLPPPVAAQVAHFVWCIMLSKGPNPAANAAAAAAVITLAAVAAGGEEASEEEEEEVEQEEAELVLGVLEEEEEQMEEVGQAM